MKLHSLLILSNLVLTFVPFGSNGQDINCESISSCRQCLSYNPLCLWCGSTSSCINETDRNNCDKIESCPCSTYFECKTCANQNHCGWCLIDSKGVCLYGSSSHSSDGKCQGSNWVYSSSQCPEETTNEFSFLGMSLVTFVCLSIAIYIIVFCIFPICVAWIITRRKNKGYEVIQ